MQHLVLAVVPDDGQVLSLFLEAYVIQFVIHHLYHVEVIEKMDGVWTVLIYR